MTYTNDVKWKRAQSIVGTSKGRPDTDFYPTPASSVIPLLDIECFDKSKLIWECACGTGWISELLISKGFRVVSTDLNNFGYGVSDVNFLDTKDGQYPKIIITNPPFSLISEFIEHAIFDLRTEKVAFFAKLSLLEGEKRSRLLEQTPLSKVHVFRKRQTLTRYGEKTKNCGMIAFAWFVWERGYNGKPQVDWI